MFLINYHAMIINFGFCNINLSPINIFFNKPELKMKKGILLIFFATFLLVQLLQAQIQKTTKVNSSTTTNSCSMAVQNANNIYEVFKRGSGSTVADNQIKFCKSTDAGSTFTESDITVSGLYTSETPLIGCNANSVLVKYNFNDGQKNKTAILRSTNNGNSITYKTIDNDSLERCDNLISDGNSTYLLSYYEDYLYISTNDGVDFKRAKSPNTNLNYINYVITNNAIWAVGTISGKDSILVYKSTNQGNSWQFTNHIYADMPYSSDFNAVKKNNDLYIVFIHEEVGTYYYKSIQFTNGIIATPKIIYQNTSKNFPIANIVFTANRAFFYDYSNACYTTDNGTSWSKNYYADAELQGYPTTGKEIPISDNTIYMNYYYNSSGLKNNYFANITLIDYPISTIKNDTIISNQNYINLRCNVYFSMPKYQIQVSKSSFFTTNIIDNIFKNDYSWNYYYYKLDLENITANGNKYYYRIRGIDGNAFTNWSKTYSFIYGIQIPKVVINTANNGNAVYPDWFEFQWNGLNGISGYQIHQSSNLNFTDTILFKGFSYSNTNKTSVYPGLNGKFYLRVRGYDSYTGSYGEWSNPLSYNYSGYPYTSNEKSSKISKEFNLGQNFPNPFNPTTKIKYDIPNSVNVLLKVFNQLGQEVKTLVNENKQAGSYEADFDASALPSGIYFYKIIAGTYTKTNKMLLIK